MSENSENLGKDVAQGAAAGATTGAATWGAAAAFAAGPTAGTAVPGAVYGGSTLLGQLAGATIAFGTLSPAIPILAGAGIGIGLVALFKRRKQ